MASPGPGWRLVGMTTSTTSTPITTESARTRLEDGVAASTPPGDNLLADFVRAEAAAYRSLAVAAGGRAEVDDELGLSMGDSGSPCFFGNVAHVARPLDGPAAAEAVRRIRSFYADASGGPFLVFTPWSIGDRGADDFTLAGHPPLMVRPAGGQVPTIDGVRIERATTAGQVATFDRTITEAYPAEALLPFGSQPPMFTPAILDTPWRCFVGSLDDRPVATAAAFVTDEVVVVEAVSTRPECRGRGIGAAVTAAAMLADPTRPSALLSSDGGHSVYAGLGYLTVMRLTLWIGMR